MLETAQGTIAIVIFLRLRDNRWTVLIARRVLGSSDRAETVHSSRVYCNYAGQLRRNTRYQERNTGNGTKLETRMLPNWLRGTPYFPRVRWCPERNFRGTSMQLAWNFQDVWEYPGLWWKCEMNGRWMARCADSGQEVKSWWTYGIMGLERVLWYSWIKKTHTSFLTFLNII